jgi:hypothetical protein
MEANEKKDKKSMDTRQRDLSEFLYFFKWGVHMSLAFFVILLLGIMTSVWGNLAKAQDDAETIEEAIERIVAEHNAEPTAHTAEGEAIDVHRKNEVVDHPAGSVLADKASFTEIVAKTQFESIDGWGNNGFYTLGFPGINLYAIYGDNVRSYLASQQDGLNSWALFSREFLYQESANVAGFDSDTKLMWGLIPGSYSPSTYYTGVGVYWYISGGNLYARVKSSTTTSDELITGVTLTTPHTYRTHYVPTDGNVYWYIDGELVATIAVPSGSFNSAWFYMHFLEETGTGYESYAYFYELMLSFTI